MLTYIDAQLRMWAEWSAMKADGQVWVSQFRYREYTPSAPNARGRQPVVNEECLAVERAVAHLGLQRRELFDVVCSHYRDRPEWSAAMRAVWLRVSQRTYWRRLESAHVLLLGLLVDDAAGVGQSPVKRAKRLKEEAA